MLEVSRDASAEGEEQLETFTAEKSKHCSICTVTLTLAAIYLSRVGGRWQCLRGGAGGLNGCYACGCSTEYRCGALLGGELWRHAREYGAHCPFEAQRGDGAHCLSQK